MGLLRVVEWKDYSGNTIVHKLDLSASRDFIGKGSKLTVRESQAVVFCDKGRMADVFLPGYYDLSTDNIPILTRLMSWKYGFESPFKSDVFFVNTKQFANNRWGTRNPILLRDPEYGAIRIGAYGTYAFKVKDPYVFLTEYSGTNREYTTERITDWLRSMLVTRLTDIIGESKIPVLDMAANLVELGDMVREKLTATFDAMGLELCLFNFENFSLPENLQAALDESTTLGILAPRMDTYTRKAAADAMVTAASNPGAGSTMGAGMGMGMGMTMGSMMGGMMGGMGMGAGAPTASCASCGATFAVGTKFCPTCGTAVAPAGGGFKCPACEHDVPAGAKFCPDCGTAIVTKCPSCGKDVAPGTRFCPDCGTRL